MAYKVPPVSGHLSKPFVSCCGPTDYFTLEALVQHLDDVNTLLLNTVAYKVPPVSGHCSKLFVSCCGPTLKVLIQHLDDLNILLRKPVTSEDHLQCLNTEDICQLP